MTTSGVGPNGQWTSYPDVPAQVGPEYATVLTPAALRRAKYCTIRPISQLDLGDVNGATFRQMYAAPKSGWAAVRARYLTDRTAGTSAITATSYAGGRDISQDNPTTTGGAASSWSVVGGTTLTAADASFATNGLRGEGKAPYGLVYVPDAVTRSGPGWVYVNTQPAGVNNRAIVASDAQEYETVSSGLLPRMEYRARIGAGTTDYTTVNQGAFVSNGQSWQGNYHVAMGIDFIPLDGAQIESLHLYGDSTVDGFTKGLGNTAVATYAYSYGAIAVSLMIQAGRPMTYASWGSMGKDGPYFCGVLAQNLSEAASAYRPTMVGIQAFSRNGTFTQSAVDAAIVASYAQYDACVAAGIKVFLITVPSSFGDTDAQTVQRCRGNAEVRGSGRVYFDLDLVLMDQQATPRPKMAAAYTYDDTHFSRLGNEAGGRSLFQFLQTL